MQPYVVCSCCTEVGERLALLQCHNWQPAHTCKGVLTDGCGVMQCHTQGQQTKGLIKCGTSSPCLCKLLTGSLLQSQGKGQQTKGLIKCGRCPPCLRPQMRKACLRPLFVGTSAADPTGAPSK